MEEMTPLITRVLAVTLTANQTQGVQYQAPDGTLFDSFVLSRVCEGHRSAMDFKKVLEDWKILSDDGTTGGLEPLVNRLLSAIDPKQTPRADPPALLGDARISLEIVEHSPILHDCEDTVVTVVSHLSGEPEEVTGTISELSVLHWASRFDTVRCSNSRLYSAVLHALSKGYNRTMKNKVVLIADGLKAYVTVHDKE